MRIGKRFRQCMLICCFFGAVSSVALANQNPGIPSVDQIMASLEATDLPGAVKLLTTRLENLDPEASFPAYLDCVLLLESTYRAMGMRRLALDLMTRHLTLIQNRKSPRAKAIFFTTLADLYLAMGHPALAVPHAESARENAMLVNDPRLRATVLNNLGNVRAVAGDTVEAEALFDEALFHAEKIGAGGGGQLLPAIITNQLKLRAGKSAPGRADLEKLYVAIEGMAVSSQKADRFLSLAQILISALGTGVPPVPEPDGNVFRGMAYQALTAARQIAVRLRIPVTEAMAAAGMGRLYELDARFDEAIVLTKQAIQLSLRSDRTGKRYLWQWQLGRLLNKTGKTGEAVQAYEQAIEMLDPVKNSISSGFRGRKAHFDHQVRPVYLELAQLYLDRAVSARDDLLRRDWLMMARDTMETFKALVLQDFFQDECIAALENRQTIIDRPDPHTAVVYPILFPDVIQLLLFFSDTVHHIRIPIENTAFQKNVREFRRRLQNSAHTRYRFYAKKLYDRLIRPLENELEKRDIKTLVIVPDGVLHLIPFSALHNGRSHLVETYEIATVPGITLVGAAGAEPGRDKILLGGLSKGIEDFQDLPHVPQELETIRALAQGTILLDKAFTLEALERHLEKENYTMVHLATHGVFEPDARANYLKTHDGKITMEDLRQLMAITRFRDHPVSLLTLGSCQTALGDERAALGLGGVALKAGVRSSLATLWLVSDKAASMVTTGFYRQLLTRGVSKARALQSAQKQLIRDPLLNHPAFWAPFLLIGAWN